MGIRENNGETGNNVAAGNASTEAFSPLFRQHFHSDAESTSAAAQNISEDIVESALRRLPSNGWIGRRDRALLVLSAIAGLRYESIAELTVADVTVRDGIAVITTPGGRTTLRKQDDALVCPPCALARWLHALDMTAVYGSCRVSTAVIARSAPLTSRSPHLCLGSTSVAENTLHMALVPDIDQYGPLAVAKSPVARRREPSHAAAGRIPAQRGSATRWIAPGFPSGATTSDDQSDPFGGRVKGLEDRAKSLLDSRSGDPVLS